MNSGTDGQDLKRVVYLCINRVSWLRIQLTNQPFLTDCFIAQLCPDYMGIELGIGESLIIKAIAQSTGRKPADIKADFLKVGDLGLVAEVSAFGLAPQYDFQTKLLVSLIWTAIQGAAADLGKAETSDRSFCLQNPRRHRQGKRSERELALLCRRCRVRTNLFMQSQTRKVGFIQKILTSCQGSETRFIIRSLEGKLRIGLAEKTLVTALAHAIVLKEIGSKKVSQGDLAEKLARGNEIVKQVYRYGLWIHFDERARLTAACISELPNYDLVVPALFAHGVNGLRKACKLTPGKPT